MAHTFILLAESAVIHLVKFIFKNKITQITNKGLDFIRSLRRLPILVTKRRSESAGAARMLTLHGWIRGNNPASITSIPMISGNVSARQHAA